MAARAFVGFDHIANGDVDWPSKSTHGITRSGVVTSTIEDGWISSKSAGAASSERVNVPLTPYLAAPTSKIFFGVRVRLKAVANAAAGIFYWNNAVLLAVNQIPNWKVGSTYYIDIAVDLVAGTWDMYVDSTRVRGSSGAGYQSRTVVVGLEGKGTTANQIDWRDIVIHDDIDAGNGQIDRVGDRVVAPFRIATVDAPQWTTNTGTVLDAINPGSPDAYAISPSPATLLTARMLAPDIPNGSTIDAIDVLTSLRCTVASGSNVGVQLKQGGTTKTLPSIPAGIAKSYKTPGPVVRAPDGGVWTAEKIAALDVIVTPSV